jgi:hypothetical protein
LRASFLAEYNKKGEAIGALQTSTERPFFGICVCTCTGDSD